MADTVDIQNLNLTMGEIKALLMSINTEKKDDRRTNPPDMSELKKILEDAFKPFTEEMKANTKAVEGMKELTKAIEESNNLSKKKKSKTPPPSPTGTPPPSPTVGTKTPKTPKKRTRNRIYDEEDGLTPEEIKEGIEFTKTWKETHPPLSYFEPIYGY